MTPFAEALKMPLWEGCPWPIPEEVEVRARGDLGVLRVKGTDRFVGVILSRFDASSVPEMLNRLGVSLREAASPGPV